MSPTKAPDNQTVKQRRMLRVSKDLAMRAGTKKPASAIAKPSTRKIRLEREQQQFLAPKSQTSARSHPLMQQISIKHRTFSNSTEPPLCQQKPTE